MSFYPSVQALIGTHTVGADGDQCAVDWKNNKAYLMAGAIGSAHYIARLGIVTGAEEAFHDLADYGTGLLEGTPVGLDSAQRIYLVQPFDNYGGVLQIDGKTLEPILQWGFGSEFLNLPFGIPQTGQFANVVVGNNQFMLSAGLGGVEGFLNQLAVLNGPTFAGSIASWDGTNGAVCTGVAGSKTGFVISGPESGAFPQHLALLKVTCNSLGDWTPGDWPNQNADIVFATIGTVLPTDVDPLWTEISQSGICVDQTDGNLIVCVFGQPAAVQHDYIVKMSATDGTVLWKVPVGSTALTSMIAYSSITHQRFAFLSPTAGGSVTTINTADGTFTVDSVGYEGVIASCGAYNDTTGALVVSGEFLNDGPGSSPTPLNATPDNFFGWMVLYVNPAYVPPPPNKVGYTKIWGNWK